MSASTAPAAKLDDLMVAMDVVDTIRHREDVLERELAQGDSDAALIERLRDIYQQQGIKVSDEQLKEGVKALKEQRFAYKAPPDGFLTWLFRQWIRRGRAIAIALVVLGLGGVVWAGSANNWFSPDEAQVAADKAALERELPDGLAAAVTQTRAASQDAEADRQIAALTAAGEAAIRNENAAGVRKAIGDLNALRSRLDQTYDLMIVSRPGEPTAIWRVPDDNQSARNYYVIVEAIGAGGTKLSLPITSEEDQKTRTVSKFAVRVPQSTYSAIGADKQADGIVQDSLLGRKVPGKLGVDFLKPAEAGYITEW
jgi:hypothetical protein